MTERRHILCPVDPSDISRKAFSCAAALAGRFGTDLVALHVLSPSVLPLTGFPPYVPPALLEPGDREVAEAWMELLISGPRRDGLPVRTLLVEGDPAQRILETERSLPADLIVLGTHGHGGLNRLVLGSVAEQVLRKASGPVLTVPPAAAAPGAAFREIVCAVDFSDASREALVHAVTLALAMPARLVLVHVVESLPAEDARPLPFLDDPESRRLRLADAGKRLGELVAEDVRKKLELELVVVPGKPSRGILEIAAKKEADLIVVGVEGRGAFDLLLLGSTTNQLVRHATCPVLSVRGPDRADAAAAKPPLTESLRDSNAAAPTAHTR